MNGRILFATGAYGRKANQTDWENGKDFRIVQGPYFSIRDTQALKDEGFETIFFVHGASHIFSIEIE